jgi:hypothetical protein
MCAPRNSIALAQHMPATAPPLTLCRTQDYSDYSSSSEEDYSDEEGEEGEESE